MLESRAIARNAFQAGNDLLLLSDFGLNPRVEQFSKIVDTLASFATRYQADAEFAARVDAAVRRILALKLKLYGGPFSPANAERPFAALDQLGSGTESVMRLSQAAASLVYPIPSELDVRAPEPPTAAQRVVFITDAREARQCSTCPSEPLLDRSALELEVLALYGPNGSGQARANNLQSYTFDELAAYLNSPAPGPVGDETPTPAPSPVETALLQADWIVFSMLDVTADVPSSGVVSTFLAQRPDLVRSKKVLVFAFNAPYYLDTTDLSKLTAYYALYSRAPQFVTAAARILYRDLVPRAAPPVSVAGAGYYINDVIRPNPAQIIALSCERANPPADAGPDCTGLRLNDTITVTTGVLQDRNGHTVPDNTPVTFRVYYPDLDLDQTVPVGTKGGVAVYALVLNRPGQLVITAGSDAAQVSTTFNFNVQQEEEFGITPIVPTSAPTDTPQPTNTEPPPTATATITPSPTATPDPPPPPTVEWRGFFVMFLGLIAVLLSGYRLGTLEDPQARNGIRVALAGAIGVLAGYIFVALSLPGTMTAYMVLKVFAAPVSAILGGIVGLAAGWYWFVGRSLPK